MEQSRSRRMSRKAKIAIVAASVVAVVSLFLVVCPAVPVTEIPGGSGRLGHLQVRTFVPGMRAYAATVCVPPGSVEFGPSQPVPLATVFWSNGRRSSAMIGSMKMVQRGGNLVDCLGLHWSTLSHARPIALWVGGRLFRCSITSNKEFEEYTRALENDQP